MRYRKLDQNRDMQFGHNAADIWHDVPDAVGQSVLTRLLLFAGEWWLDITAGTPWGGYPFNDDVVRQGRILGAHTQLSRDAAIRDRIITTEGVQTLVEYGSHFDPNTRAFSVNATIDTIYGGRIALTIAPSPADSTVPEVRYRIAQTAFPRRPPPPVLRSLPRR